MLTSDAEAPPSEPGPAAPEPVRARSRHRVARVVGAVGRLMMTSGTVILLLVAYQLWGTNLQTERAQGQLADEYEALAAEGPAPSTTGSTTTTEAPTASTGPPATTPPRAAPVIAPPALGEPIGSFSIPAIGVQRFWTVEGDGPEQLKRGAAHYPGTPLPGQAGNAAVAGHRTTYGAPLHNVEKLVPGDEITFETRQGTFRYEVRETRIISPYDTEVIGPQGATPENPAGENLLTLTACHPKFSAEQRIIVVAELVGNPVEKLDGQDEAAERVRQELGSERGEGDAIDDFATEPALRFPGALWGLACMALWALVRLGAWWAHRSRRLPRVVPYLVGTPACLVLLYLFFESFSYEGFARSVGLSI